MFKRILIAAICLIVAFSSLIGCDSSDNFDGTVLKVAIFKGGWGDEWLSKVAREFESIYPEYRIDISGDKKYSMANLLGTIGGLEQDLYIAPIYFYDFVSQNKMLDISSVMTTPLNEQLRDCDETATIKSKMWGDLDEFYSGYRGEGKYYGVPFGGGIYSLNYDIDLFDQKKLFIASGTSAPNITWVGRSGNLSEGQDGEAGTYDDGLPVTYADFKALLAKMKLENITPFIWSSQTGYTNNMLYSLFASYEGKENFNIIKNMSGEYTFAGDSEPTTITKDNAYLLQQMTGREKALKFAYDIIQERYYHDMSGNASMDFQTAQDTYLYSVELAKSGGEEKRIAFLVDGGHWYNEASDTLNEMASMSPEYADRKFGIMPFPKFDGSPATKATYFASSFYNCMFIRSGAKQPELAKLFMAYLNTDAAMQMCTEVSGMVRPLTYDMPKEKLNNMPEYYQSMWAAFTVNSDIVYHTINNPTIYKNEAFFEQQWKWSATDSNKKTYSAPLIDFRRDTSLTVQGYMDALKYTYTEEFWKTQVLR